MPAIEEDEEGQEGADQKQIRREERLGVNKWEEVGSSGRFTFQS